MRLKRFLPYLPIVLIPALGVALSLTVPLTRELTTGLTKVGAILDLDLHSWWTAADLQGDYQTVSQGGTSSAPDAQLGSTSAADSNDPLYLDWQDNSDTDPLYVTLDGSTGFISQPDSAGNSGTGDLDVRVKVALDDWITGGGAQVFAAKRTNIATQKSWIFYVNATGNLILVLSDDGSSQESKTSSVAVSFIDGEMVCVRVTYDASTGDVIFYTSTDNAVTWDQLGAIQSSSLTSIFDSTSEIEIGSNEGGTSALAAGKFYEFQLRSGIDGPIVSHWRAQDMGDSGGPDVAPTPLDDWTLNGGYSVAKPSGNYVYLPGTASNYISSTNPDLTGDQTWTIWCAADDWASGVRQNLMAVYNTTGNQRAWRFLLDGTGNVEVFTSADGVAFNTDVTATAISATNGEWYGIQGKYDASAGTCEILTSVDGQSWTAHDTLTGLDTSIFSSSEGLQVGMRPTNVEPFAGEIGWATIHDNLTPDTTDPVWRFDAGSSLMTQTGYTDPYSGDAISINRSATGLKSTWVTRPVFVLNSAASTYLEVADHADLDMGAGDDFTVWVYGRMHDVTANGRYLIKGTTDFYDLVNLGASEQKHYLRIDDGPNVATTVGQYVDWTASQASLLSGARTGTDIYIGTNGTISSSVDASSVIGSLANSGAFYIGDIVAPAEMELFAWGVIKGTALTASQLSQLKTEVDTRLGGTTGGYFLLLFIPLFRRKRNVIDFPPQDERRAA